MCIQNSDHLHTGLFTDVGFAFFCFSYFVVNGVQQSSANNVLRLKLNVT
jgi:hypothetical protein